MPTRVLGIDPGIAMMGYGVVEEDNDELRALDYGCLSTPAKQGTPDRLLTLYRGVTDLIERYRPSEMAVEQFVGRNLRTALSVGQARGVAILAAASKGLPVYEYTPLQVKKNVSGYGRGDKAQVQEMVRIQVGLECVPEPDDAADALAIAICHISKARIFRVLASGR